MGRRQRGAKRKGTDGNASHTAVVKKKAPRRKRSGDYQSDPARALVAVDPSGDFLATSCGSKVYIYSTKQGASVELTESEQGEAIRVLAFDESGKHLLAAGDNKACCVWDLDCRALILKSVAPKKVSAACFLADTSYVALADKFGEVYVAPVPQSSSASADPPEASRPHKLLGHFSTIITNLTALPGKPRLVGTDREGKVRVNRLAKNLIEGPTCIQSFCLGHTAFVTSLAVLKSEAAPLLASGSGDGTVRLWNSTDGAQLDCFDTTPHLLQSPEQTRDTAQVASVGEEGDTEMADVAAQSSGGAAPSAMDSEDEAEADADISGAEGGMDSDGGQALEDGLDGGGLNSARRREQLPPAVVAIIDSKEGDTLAVAVEGESQLLVLQISADHHLSLRGRAAIPGVALPVSLAVNPRGILWAAGGCAGQQSLSLGCLTLPWTEGVEKESSCTAEMRTALGADGLENGANGWAPGLQVSLELRRACYSFEEITRRKQKRMDIAAAGHP